MFFVAFAAHAEARLALLIGNQDYTAKVGPLKNPVRDIELVGAALEKLGFSVTKLANATKAQMDEAIRRHADQVRRAGPGAIGFFYYSGHGAANPETNVNYLIPADLDSADGDALWYRSIEQPFLIELLSQRARNATHFIVFDACRNELNIGGEAGKALGADKGFVPVSDVSGILIAYATTQKKTAADTGMFARILSEELVKPGVEAFAVFREVQVRVKEAMHQEPWMSLNYIPRIYLGAKAPGPDGPSALQPVPPLSEAAEAWRILRESGSEAELEAFIKRFGGTVFGDFARARLAEVKRTKIAAAKPEVRAHGLSNTHWDCMTSDKQKCNIWFLPDGSLKYQESLDDEPSYGRWKQEGTKVFLSINGYSSYTGAFANDAILEGDAINAIGQTWTWRFSKVEN